MNANTNLNTSINGSSDPSSPASTLNPAYSSTETEAIPNTDAPGANGTTRVAKKPSSFQQIRVNSELIQPLSKRSDNILIIH